MWRVSHKGFCLEETSCEGFSYEEIYFEEIYLRRGLFSKRFIFEEIYFRRDFIQWDLFRRDNWVFAYIGKQFFCQFASNLMLILISTLIGQYECYSAICSGPDKTLLDYSQLWSGPVKRTIIFIQVLTWAYSLNSKPFSRFGKVHIESKEYIYWSMSLCIWYFTTISGCYIT